MKLKSPTDIFLTVSCCVFLSGLLSACGSSKVNTDYLYFQNGANIVVAQQKETVIQPNDLLSIQVYSKTLNQDQALIFNIPATVSVGGVLAGYQVNDAGNVEMPLIGAVKAAGLTKGQLQTALVQKITNFVKEPSVLIRLLQFNVSVLGEVKAPGTKIFAVDKVTVIDALSAAGDLTDNGKRNEIMVIREEAGKKIFHTIDLRDKSVFQSPAYILQPNDIVYVRPSTNKLKVLDTDTEKQRRLNTALSLSSVAFGLLALILTIVR